MPSGSRALVIGGGINAGSPFALDQYLYVTSINPAEAASSPHLVHGTNSIEAPGRQPRANRNTVIGTGTTDISSAALQDAVVIGHNVVAQSASSPTTSLVGIGNNVVLGNTTAAVAIGGPIPGGGVGSIVIGSTSGAGASLFNSGVVVGYTVNLSGTFDGVVIGANGVSSGGSSTVVGTNSSGGTICTVIGAGSGGNGNQSTLVGQGQSMTAGSQNNCLIGLGTAVGATNNVVTLGIGAASMGNGWVTIGNGNLGTLGFSSNVLFGGADLHTNGAVPPTQTFRFRNAQGTDIAAGDHIVIGPRSTGNAVPARMLFQTGTAGASGVTLQTASTAFVIDGAENIALGSAAPSYGGGSRVMFIGDRLTAPTTNPVGGGVLYSVAGALTWRGSGGTVTTIAPA